MQFLICPVPIKDIPYIEPEDLFQGPSGTCFYYAVNFTGDKISISDTASRSVEFSIEMLGNVIDQIKQAQKRNNPIFILFDGLREVPMDQKEAVSLLFILNRIHKYTQDQRIIQYLQDPVNAEAYLYAALTAGAEE